MNQLATLTEFNIEDNLLFWKGYFISSSYSELNSQQLQMIQAICNELLEIGMNPEDFFATTSLDSSYIGLVEALQKLKSNQYH
jgi:hypothetical protein